MPINHLNSAFPDARWGTQLPTMDPTTKTWSSKHKGPMWSNTDQHHRHTANTSMLCTHYNHPNFNPNQHHHSQNHAEAEQEMELERQLMFEKPLTPSDVGKLNRLVIPKQHAETYFPLCGRDSGENGLLLSFEDESGRCWRFRYSYWNSSQSYVLTKGWSRFVKEKRLDAGDFVLFERHRLDSHRLFIGWRRNAAPLVQDQPAAVASHGDGWTPVFYPAHPYPSPPHGPLLPCPPESFHGLVLQKEATPSGSPKRLRLFGVTLDCQPESEPPVLDGPSMSRQGLTPGQYYSHNYMDTSFLGNVNRLRYREG